MTASLNYFGHDQLEYEYTTFPLSPKSDAWEIMGGANDWLSNWEDVSHRN